MYPEELVAPMRKELTNAGFTELLTAEEAEKAISTNQGTMLLVVNSVCGCAAGTARPGIIMALKNSGIKPDALTTVFAGMETAAVQKARQHMMPYPPSSPAIALFKGDQVVSMIERHQIEGRPAEMIAQHLTQLFNEYCKTEEVA